MYTSQRKADNLLLTNVFTVERALEASSASSPNAVPVSLGKDKRFVKRWNDEQSDIAGALTCLQTWAVLIKKQPQVSTFLTADDVLFRRDAASFVRWRFPAARKALCQQLGDGIAVRRRMLLQSNRHAKWLPFIRSAQIGSSPPSPGQNPQPTSGLTPSDNTKVSRPDTKAEVDSSIHHHRRRRMERRKWNARIARHL